MKSFKILLIPFAIILLISCDTNELNGPMFDENVKEVTSIQDLVEIAKQLEANIPSEVLNGQINPKTYSINNESEKIAEILEPLRKVGLSVKDEMLSDAKLSTTELENLSNLTDQELVLAGILRIIINEQQQIMNRNYKTKNSHYTTEGITLEQLGECIMDASGIAAFREMIVSNAALNADVILTASKKLFKRTLGWVGVAIFAYELATCLQTE